MSYLQKKGWTNDYPGLKTELKGLYQLKKRTILTAIPLLKRPDTALTKGGAQRFARVCGTDGA